jgi:hypothetical protein
LIVPHEIATGTDCDGCLIIEEREMWRILNATLAAQWSMRFPSGAPVHG